MTRREQLRDFVRHLATASSTASLYRPEHPQVRRLCGLALKMLLRRPLPEQGLSLLFVEDELVADGQSLGRSLYIHRLARLLRQWHVGHLKLLPGLGEEDLLKLVAQLATPRPGATLRSSDHLSLGRVEVRYRKEGEPVATADPGPEPTAQELEDLEISAAFAENAPGIEEVDEEELARFSEICEAVRRHRNLHVVGISEIVARFVASFTSEAGSFLALAPLRKLDEYTFLHSVNVCTLSIAQAMSLGISGQLLHDIGVATMLHDIGKMFMPDELIKKEARYDEADWQIMRQHPVLGANYLMGTPGVPRLAIVAAYEHHMKYDGTGYPARPPGWQPHLVSQICSVSDYFDAMRTERSFSGAMEVHMISQELLRFSGGDLHPDLTHNFLRMLENILARAGDPPRPAAPPHQTEN